MAPNPSIYNDSLLFEFSGPNRSVYAFNARTGKYLWKTALAMEEYMDQMTVHADGQTVYAVTTGQPGGRGMFLYSLDLSTGRIINKLSYPLDIFMLLKLIQ